MITMVLASTLIKANSDGPKADRRELERSYSGLQYGLRDVGRVAAGLGAVALYAWVLVFMAH